MKRFERRRVERLRRTVITIGLSFALGALIDIALTWRLHEFDLGRRDVIETTASAETAAAAAPTASQAASAPVATSYVVPRGDEIEALKRRRLEMPVEGVKPSQLHDTFTDSRALGRTHEAIDIMASRGTPVHAVEDGTIAKLFTSVAGGITIYQFDPSGAFCYYYAHLDSYASGLHQGQAIHRGQVIGYVGSTGNASADAPHLHFSIFRLTPEHQWWKGEPINPYPILK
jgi:murein DD-endopeptidase MepM/ murein hydrolase activator NlpD